MTSIGRSILVALVRATQCNVTAAVFECTADTAEQSMTKGGLWVQGQAFNMHSISYNSSIASSSMSTTRNSLHLPTSSVPEEDHVKPTAHTRKDSFSTRRASSRLGEVARMERATSMAKIQSLRQKYAHTSDIGILLEVIPPLKTVADPILSDNGSEEDVAVSTTRRGTSNELGVNLGDGGDQSAGVSKVPSDERCPAVQLPRKSVFYIWRIV